MPLVTVTLRRPRDAAFVETAWENWAFGGGRLLHAS